MCCFCPSENEAPVQIIFTIASDKYLKYNITKMFFNFHFLRGFYKEYGWICQLSEIF